jgi:hypothetical protein
MPNQEGNSQTAQLLIEPLRRLLRPLVYLLLRRGIHFPALTELLRQIYVDVAQDTLGTDPKARTDSRISILTGIHRKDVRRLRSELGTEPQVPVTVTLTSQIIARWLGAPDYRDEAGAPRILPRIAPAKGPSFEQLVRSVTTDVRPRSVLDDLLAQGAVVMEAGNSVRLDVSAFIPRAGGEEQLFYFSRNLHDHFAAAVANVLAESTAPFLDRSVHYDELTEEAAAELEALARTEAIKTLVAFNQQAIRIADRDDKEAAPTAKRGRRVNLGIYLYVADDDASVNPDA